MTEAGAREVVGILGDAYHLSQRRLDWFARMLLRYPAGPTAQVLEQLVEREKTVPTVAQIGQAVRQQLETLGANSPVFQPRSERLEALVVWRSVLEDPASAPLFREDARDRISWMDPPCLAAEWREARTIADARHAARNEQLQREGKPPRPPRPALSWPVPPPPEPQPMLSRVACVAGMRALWQGFQARLDGPALERKVVAAVRAAPTPDALPAGDEW